MPVKETELPVKLIYNVDLGKEVEYTLEVDDNNEVLAKSTENGHFLKFPNVSEEEIDDLIEKHNAEASTQVKKQPLFGGKVKPVEVEVEDLE